MKWIAFLLATFVITAASAVDRKSILRSGYVVVSDVYSNDVPAGKCVVTGTVFSPDYDTNGQHTLQGATISTLNQTKKTTSDSSGKYKLMLDSKDTTIYLFYSQYEEVVVWKYAFQSRHVVTINFYPNYDAGMIEADKPVIYLYSENPLEAQVKFASKGAVTFTYPTYQESWNVRVDKTGLYNAETGRTYPYLFWEGEMTNLDFKWEESAIKGAIIKTDTVISFFENSLQAMGLNATEQTDFITFWAPRMTTSEYALVQFLNTADYDAMIASLTVSPTPDKLLRVYMLFSPLKSDKLPIDVQPQQFEKFERTGFTVVEWGGSELPPLTLIP